MGTRPLLPNNFKIDSRHTIKERVEQAFFAEVYLTHEGKYFILFQDVSLDTVINPKLKNNIVKLTIGDKEYVGLLTDKFSKESLYFLRQELSTLRGFDAVAGMIDLKKLLLRDVIDPHRNPEKYNKYRLSVPNGILLFGPPGCGKTFIVRRLAEELNYSFVELKHSDVASPFIHESVTRISSVFAKAQQAAPSIVFIDEMAGLVPRRETLTGAFAHKEEEVNEFLMQMDNQGKKGILVIGATNYPERIDPAILRSGRMDKRIFIPPPDYEARKEMFRIHLSNRPCEPNIDLDNLAKQTANYVASDIELIVNNAARLALSRNIPINLFILNEILKAFQPSIDDEMLNRFQAFAHIERK